MHFDIRHVTHYRYSRPVFLEPHTLRFQPRACGAQVVLNYRLEIDPAPAGLSHFLDAQGNVVTNAWFDREHRELTVTAQSRVETLRTNPFDYLLPAGKPTLPDCYAPRLSELLAPALARPKAAGDDPVAAFAEPLRQQSAGRLRSFLTALTQTFYDDWEVLHREDGDPWPPGETLRKRRGACRDLAVLFIDACRAVGLAARFVSGYQEGDSDQTRRELHAWAEVYLPGGGWRGFDPTHGLSVADRHVAVAAAVEPRDAAPVTGALRGTGATAAMHTDIQLQALAQPAMQHQR